MLTRGVSVQRPRWTSTVTANFRREHVDRPHGRQHQQRDLAASRLLIGEVRRVQVSHVGPHLMPFLAFLGSRQVASNAWVAICTPIVLLSKTFKYHPGCVSAPPFDATTTDLATDVAVDQRPDIDLR